MEQLITFITGDNFHGADEFYTNHLTITNVTSYEEDEFVNFHVITQKTATGEVLGKYNMAMTDRELNSFIKERRLEFLSNPFQEYEIQQGK